VSREEIGAHKQSLAVTLQRLRTERGLSQSQLGRATGISSSFLSLIEQGRSDITIGRLLRLAEFYELELTDLLNDGRESDRHPVQVLRADPENMVHSDAEGVDLFDLTGGSRWALVPALGVHQPGSEVEINHLHEHETMLFVLDGTFELEVAGREPVRLRRGEGAIYRDIPSYRIRNVSKRVGRVLGMSPRHRPRA
jgi:transcriptional regulator with XRE-family HTH domain